MDENDAAGESRLSQLAGPAFMAICAAFVGCFALFGVCFAFWQHSRLDQYRPIPAVVLSSSVKLETHDDGAGWSPVIRFRYVVNERTYTSDKVFVLSEFSGFHGWARSFCDRYRPGQITTAYYNPADPADAILIRRYSFIPYFFILLPMAMDVILIASLAPTLLHLPPRRNALMASVLWHGTALLAAGHYFSVTTRPYETIPLIVTGIYEWAGIVPLGLALPKSGFAGRLRTALLLAVGFSVVGASLGLLVMPVGLLVRWVTPWFMKHPIGGAHWGVYGLMIGAVAFGAVAFVASLLGYAHLGETKERTS